MKRGIVFALLLLLILLNIFCESRSGDRKKRLQDEIEKSGKIVSIIDGDTYDILLDGRKVIRVRMEGIDAPEKGMPFYKKAKNHLSILCFDKYVKLKILGKYRHDRTLAFSYLEDGTELSHEMLKAGLAWHFKKYNSDTDLELLEKEARMSKIGIWSLNNPKSPWENRALYRNGVSTKDSFRIKEGEW